MWMVGSFYLFDKLFKTKKKHILKSKDLLAWELKPPRGSNGKCYAYPTPYSQTPKSNNIDDCEIKEVKCLN